MRRSNLLSYSIFPTLLLSFAACGGDDGGDPAHFAGATELQRQRAVIAGSGVDAAFAFLVGSFSISPDPEATCPTVVRSGAKTTATFDCTDDSGTRIDGRIIATNVASIFEGGPAADPDSDAILVFEGFRQHGPTAAEDLAFDGSVTIRPDQELVVALEAELRGITVVTDATYASDGTLTSAREGSSIDVAGVGRATIGGAWMTGDDSAGALELAGADVLRAAFSAKANGCVPLTIDGQPAGALCDEE